MSDQDLNVIRKAILDLDFEFLRNLNPMFSKMTERSIRAGVHKARFALLEASDEQREESEKWLTDNKFSTGMGDVE